jgi:hypothetical protein
MPRRDGNSATLMVPITEAMKAALTAEAWESGMSLPEYIRTLLKTRGKFARTAMRPGGYHVIGPAKEGSGL